MSITKVISQFSDILRPNLFEVFIEPPPLLSSYNQTLLKFMVLSTDFPFETIEPTLFVANSQKRKVANDISFTTLPITFRLDSRGRVLEFFQRWRNLVVSDDHRMGYYDDYVGTIFIKLLDRNHHEVFTAKLIEAFPVNRGDIPLSYETTDQFMTLTVSFEYLLAEYSREGFFLSSEWFDMVRGITDKVKLPFGLDKIFTNPFEDKARDFIRDTVDKANDAIRDIDIFNIRQTNVLTLAQERLKGLQTNVLSKYNNVLPAALSRVNIPTTVSRIKLPRLF